MPPKDRDSEPDEASVKTSHTDKSSATQNGQKVSSRPGAPSAANLSARTKVRKNLGRIAQQTPRHAPQRPTYSLAGGTQFGPHGPSYVDPDYHTYNPNHQKPKESPVWGLAKPLPRVVRAGMRRNRLEGVQEGDETVEDKQAEIAEPGSSEAIPQLGMIDDQRNDVGKERIEKRTSRARSDRGFGHQKDRRPKRAPSQGLSYNSVVDRYSSPTMERGDPMDDLGFESHAYEETDLSERRGGDLGDGVLARHETVASKQPSRMAKYRRDEGSDLEAGEAPDESGVDEEEEEQYLREENDNHNGWAEIRAKFREPLAECLATMIATLIGLCTNIAVQTSNNTYGSFQSTNWAWGLGITIGIYIAGGISGGHLNPAISLMLCLYRGFPVRKALVYIAAQVVGCFLAGLIAYGVYRDAILAFDALGGAIAVDGGSMDPVDLFLGGSGKSFYTQPTSIAGAGTAFANEFVATAILSCAILALGDDSNAPPGAGMHALIVGLVVTVLTMAFGYNTGACLNPARDLGPRLATAVVGYGGRVFTVRNAWWIYGAWGATISGGLMGGALYDVAIFVGGESPVNYPRGKRRKMKREAKDGARKRWWSFKRGVVDVQKDVQKVV